jgi:hypothetical protein
MKVLEAGEGAAPKRNQKILHLMDVDAAPGRGGGLMSPRANALAVGWGGFHGKSKDHMRRGGRLC